MISEKLAAIYNKAEDKYFDLLDFLDGKGIPVYTYSDFFENKGIPSFVVTLSVLLILMIVLAVIFTYQGPTVGQLTLSLKDSDGKALTGVALVIKDKQGIELYKGVASDGQKISLGRTLYDSDKIFITAEKTGYQPTSLEFTIGESNNSPRIRFSKDFVSIEAKVRLTDKETKTPVSGATIIVSSSDLSYELIEDNNSFYKKTGIPSGQDLILKVTAEGYNDYEQTISFLKGQVKEIQLIPSIQSYVGKAAVGISVKGIDEKLINDVKVTVYNKQNNTIEVSDFTRNGTLVSSITAGVPLRLTAEKEGYLTYDSDKSGDGVTIREKEKQINITLEQGGQNLHVTVNDSLSGLSLEGALVRIFNSDLSLFGEQITSVNGIDFSGLDPSEIIYVSAYVEGYLPAQQKVAVSSTEEVKVLLTKVTPANSARLDIYSIDIKGNPVNGVNIVVNEVRDGNILPSGLPLLQTSFAGYVSAVVQTEKTFQVIGFNDAFEAQSTIELAKGDLDKKVYLNMQKKVNVVEIKFLDVFGKEVRGTAVINGLDATTLYDGNINLGSIFFNGEGRETVEVSVTTLDGNVFTENVIIKGKTYVEVIVYNKDSASLTPIVQFVGLENENGDVVKGITPGAFYWAKFSVNYPRAASKAGIHFRAGSDNTPLSESEKIGLYDLSMQGANVEYSTSYTQNPAPGNEAVDRANFGAQGEKSKWIEGTIVQPRGTYTVKVKMRVEDFTLGKVQLKYRTWAIVGEEYYRSPIDDDLSTNGYTDTKSGLYATTSTQDLTLYESLPECTDTICVTTNFVDSDETLLATDKFEALKGKLYALEVEVTSVEQDYLQISVSSDTNLSFDSSQTGSLYFARETQVTGLQKKNASVSLSVAQEGKQKARFYFTANEIGAAKINVAIIGKSTVNKDLSFKVVNEKTLLVELSEDQVIVGKNFTIKVTDSGLVGMPNALIKINDKEGKTTKTIIGDNTEGKGKNGYYRVTNNLSVGLYTVEVSAPTYASNTTPFLVTTRNVFSFPAAIEVKMPQGQKLISIDQTLSNNSDFIIQDITVDVSGQAQSSTTEIDAETGEVIVDGSFNVIVEAPLALSKNQKQSVPITVTFNGADNDSADETATITITGLVEGQFLAKVTSEIHMIYNRKLDPTCLKFDETSAVINLIGNDGANDSASIEVTNNCDQPISLKRIIRAKTKLSAVQLDAENVLDLQAGEIKDVIITAYNRAERVRDEVYGFEIIYDSNYMKKTLNVTVKLMNPTLALSYPAQVNLYLAQGAIKDKATAAQPLFITNISAFPIENISFSQSTSYSASGVKLEIQPTGSVNLGRGQAITPAKILFATANSKITEPVESAIEITGRFGNMNNKAAQYDRYQYYDLYNEGARNLSSYAPQTSSLASYANTNRVLGVIKVLTMYSGYNCLKASLADSMSDPYMFPGAGVQLGKMITVTNLCAEPVLLSGATPADYKPTSATYGMITPLASSVMLFVPQVMIQPGAVVKVPLSITTASPSVRREKYEIVVNGVTQMSQTLIQSKPFGVKLYSGSVLTDEKSRSTKIKVKECIAPNSKETAKEVELVAPLTTDTANCSDRYCDAQNAAKYLAQKIEQVVQKARSAGYSKKDVSEDGFPCQLEGACTFAEIGMDEEELFDLYLQNDSISTNMLYKELNGLNNDGGNTTPFREGAYISSGFMVEPTLVEMGFIKSRVLQGYLKTVYFDTSFSGCGYYQVSMSGAFKSGPEGLDTMSPVIIVRAKQINGATKIVPKECKSEIGNITNFNPVDLGLNPGKEYGSWLTTINPDTKFTEMAKKISKDRFKTEDRVSASSNGNVITITQGALTNALAQICITGGDKKNIIVTVDSSIASNFDLKQKDAFSQSITQLVSSTLGGKFGDNCVIKTGDLYSCINLSELGNLGDRKLSFLSNDLMFSSSTGGCVSGTLYSTIDEQLEFSALPLDTVQTPFFGVREITVSTDDTVARPIVQLDAIIPTTTTATTTGANTTPAATPNTTPTKTNPIAPVNTSEQNETNDKLFFADAAAPLTAEQIANSTPQIAKQTISSGVIYTAKFVGGNLAPEILVNNSIQLVKSTSKQYKYYRNIKVCASPTDKDSEGKASLTEYTKANGVKFDLAVRNLLSNETIEDVKQTITINTGTLHPDDLAKFICNTSFTGKEDYKYYFTTGWNATLNEDVPELGAYLEGLKRQGIVDKCILWTDESGLTGTNAYDGPAKDAMSAGLSTYLAVCMPVSATCNAAAGLGVTIFGAIVGSILDCGIPVATTYRAELSQSSGAMKSFNDMLEKLGEATKNMPYIGAMLKGMFAIKQDIDDPDARPGVGYHIGENITESILKQWLTVGIGKATSSWPLNAQPSWYTKLVNYNSAREAVDKLPATTPPMSAAEKLGKITEMAKTPLSIRTFAEDASKELVTPYEDLLRKLTGTPAGISLSPDAQSLITKMQKSLKDNLSTTMTEKANAAYAKNGRLIKLNKFGDIPVSYAEAAKEALTTADSDFIKIASATDNVTGDSLLQKALNIKNPNPGRTMTLDELVAAIKTKAVPAMGGTPPVPISYANKELGALASNLERVLIQKNLTISPQLLQAIFLNCTPGVTHTPAVRGVSPATYVFGTVVQAACDAELFKAYGNDAAKIAQARASYDALARASAPKDFFKFRQSTASGTSIDSYNAIINNSITSQKTATEGLDQLSKVINDDVGSAVKKKGLSLADKASGTGLIQRAKTLGKTLGVGLLCSVASDQAGKAAMGKVVQDKLGALKGEAKKALNLNITLQKNKIYSLSIVKKLGEWDYSVVEVTDTKEMDKAIAEKKGEIISTKKLIENKILSSSEKLPEERKLSYWMIKTSIANAKILLAKNKYPFEGAEADHHLEIIGDKNIRQLIFDYTNPNSAFRIGGATESEVISILLYFWNPKSASGIYAQIAQEIKDPEKGGMLKEYTKKLLLIHESHAKDTSVIKLTNKEITNAFGSKVIDTDGATKLLKMIEFWRMAANESPDVSTPVPNGAVKSLPEAIAPVEQAAETTAKTPVPVTN